MDHLRRHQGKVSTLSREPKQVRARLLPCYLFVGATKVLSLQLPLVAASLRWSGGWPAQHRHWRVELVERSMVRQAYSVLKTSVGPGLLFSQL